MAKTIRYTPIGTIHSPFREPNGVPIQSATARDVEGSVEIFPQYIGGLKDISGFSHLILIYHFHLACRGKLQVRPYLERRRKHGIFSTRSPARPNSIGISTVRLEGIRGKRLRIRDVDVVDGTPILDIKPYVPNFDYRRADKIGWYSGKLEKLRYTKADNRFLR